MAERVEVDLIVEAIARGFDKVAGELKGTGQAAEETGRKTKQAGFSFTELKSALGLAQQALGYLKQGYEAVITPTLQLAQQTRDLARENSLSAREASTMIQAADDLKISYATLRTASKTLNQQGMQPNLETLINLGEQYRAFTDPVEKAQFALKKFGRAGLEMQKFLEATPEQLRDMAKGAEEAGLIMDEQAVAAARRYEIARDGLQDTLLGLKVMLGNAAIPALTAFANQLQETGMFAFGFDDILKAGVAAYKEYTGATDDSAAAADELAGALDDTTTAIQIQIPDADALAKAHEQVAKGMEAIKAAGEAWLSGTAGDVQSALEASGVKGKKFYDALGIIDALFDTQTVKSEERKDALKKITDEFKRTGDIEAYRAGLQSLYAEDFYMLAVKAGDAAGAMDHAFGVVSQFSDRTFTYTFNMVTIGSPPSGMPDWSAGEKDYVPGGARRTAPALTKPKSGRLIGDYAEGGSFIVPGSGTGDRRFSIGLAPGERVDVTPKSGRGSGGDTFNIKISNEIDLARFLALLRQAKR